MSKQRKGEFSARIKYEAWVRSSGNCEECQRPIKPGRPEYDHRTPIALAIDGLVRLDGNLYPVDSIYNCQVLCISCHHLKTSGDDRPIIDRSNRQRKTDLGLRGEKSGRPIPGSRRSGIKKKMDGTVEKRPRVHRRHQDTLERLHAKRESTFSSQSDGVVLVRTLDQVSFDVLSALNDKEHMRYSEQRHRTHTVSTQRQYIDQMLQGGHLVLGVYIAADDHTFTVLVGTMGCQVDRHNKLLDMGIMMLPGWQGLGYGTRAWRLILKWALDPEKGAFQKVEGGCYGDNGAMVQIMQASGMTYEACRPRHFLMPDGTREDLVQYGATP
jgi:RimJ/RimL family protein N-acetyltransferase